MAKLFMEYEVGDVEDILASDNGEQVFDFDAEEVASQIIQKVMELENCLYEVEINILLTDDASIGKLNAMYREKDGATDVLSFPVSSREELQKIFSYDFIMTEETDIESEEFDSSFNPESGNLILGDIVISVETLLRQASEYGHTVKREFAFLMVHGVLHLLGYGHADEEESLVMEKKQNQILEELGISR